ncbi:MAG: hypothetical protein MUC54_08940 [Chloroflexi bacterium]|nr:hypothetical protein [Chloroflexota bacterium]
MPPIEVIGWMVAPAVARTQSGRSPLLLVNVTEKVTSVSVVPATGVTAGFESDIGAAATGRAPTRSHASSTGTRTGSERRADVGRAFNERDASGRARAQGSRVERAEHRAPAGRPQWYGGHGGP